MFTQEIEQWIKNGKSYLEGVELYIKYGRYESVASFLLKGNERSDLHVEKLNSCLAEILKNGITKPQKNVSLKNKEQQSTTPATDAYLLELERKWKPIYTEMSHLHSKLCAVETNEARLALAKQIVALHEKLVDLWEQRDYYKLHGQKMPVVKRKVIKADITQTDLRKLLNARSARSQYKNIHLPKWQAILYANPTPKHKAKVEHMLRRIKHYDELIQQYEQTT